MYLSRSVSRSSTLPGAHLMKSGDHEGEVLLVASGPQASRIDAARQVVGDVEAEVDLPAGVLEVVVVEVDRAVLLHTIRPREPVPAPTPSRHRPHRHVHQLTVVTV